MDSKIFELFLEDFSECNPAIEPFSKAYFFDEEYSEHRSKSTVLGGSAKHLSRLSMLMRYGMTNKHRQAIFDGDYHLGNKRTLPEEKCTYGKLATALYTELQVTKFVDEDFQTIKDGIESVTGQSLEDHFKINRSTAFKVIYMLCWFSSQRKKSHIFQLLGTPTSEKFSMSFRDAFPYVRNSDQVWLIADLKAYLSAELRAARIDQIGNIYGTLNDWIEVTPSYVEGALFDAYSSDFESLISAYEKMTWAVSTFETTPEVNRTSLDRTLLSHIHGLESANFFAGYSELVRIAVPPIAVTPIFKEAKKLTATLRPENSNAINDMAKFFKLEDVPTLAQECRKELLEILEIALGKPLVATKFSSIVEDACNLMRAECWFGRNGNPPMQESADVSMTYILAALCCVWYSRDDSTNFKPYWHGQVAQGGSIKTSIKYHLSTPRSTVIDPIPEEHLWWSNLKRHNDRFFQT